GMARRAFAGYSLRPGCPGGETSPRAPTGSLRFHRVRAHQPEIAWPAAAAAAGSVRSHRRDLAALRLDVAHVSGRVRYRARVFRVVLQLRPRPDPGPVSWEMVRQASHPELPEWGGGGPLATLVAYRASRHAARRRAGRAFGISRGGICSRRSTCLRRRQHRRLRSVPLPCAPAAATGAPIAPV